MNSPKTLAQSVTRRGALKSFGVGLAAMTAACFGLAHKAEANPNKPPVMVQYFNRPMLLPTLPNLPACE